MLVLFYTHFKLTKLSWILLQVGNTIALLTSHAVFSHNNSQHCCKEQVWGLYSHSRTKPWHAHWQGLQSQVTSVPTLTTGPTLGPLVPSLHPLLQWKGLLGTSLTSNYRQSKLEVALRNTGRKPQDVRE